MDDQRTDRKRGGGVRGSHALRHSMATVSVALIFFVIDGNWDAVIFCVIIAALALPINLYVERHSADHENNFPTT